MKTSIRFQKGKQLGCPFNATCLIVSRTTPFMSKKAAKTRFGSLSKDFGSYSILIVNNRASTLSSLANATLAVSPAAYEVPFKIPGTPIERQLLHYFYVQAAPDLSGYSSHNFWSNVVLTSCYTDPAVRHATLALGALHRDYVVEGITKPDGDLINSNALQQYNKAICQLQKYFSNKELLDERTVLICCRLFYCIEMARQDYPAALRHAKSGLNILKDWKARQDKQPTSNMNSGPACNVRNLVEAWCDFDPQVRIFENGTPPYLALTTPEERSGAISCVPAQFHSLSHAWSVVNKLMNWGFHFLGSRIENERGLPEDTEIGNLSEKEALDEAIDQWPSVFESFMRSRDSNISSLDKDSATMCATIHRGTKVIVHLAAGRSLFDLNDDFNDILNMAGSIICNYDSKTRHRGFGFETGLVSMLWVLAMNCPDLAMRSRALWLMKMWPRREGMWNSARISSVVEKVQKSAQSKDVLIESPKVKLESSMERGRVAPGELYMQLLSSHPHSWTKTLLSF